MPGRGPVVMGFWSRMFDGFRSRWTTPSPWAYSTAPARAVMMAAAMVAESGRPARWAFSVPPGQYSSTRNAPPPASPARIALTMCGCDSRVSDPTSRANRATRSGSSRWAGSSTLTATVCPVAVSTAL